MGNLTGKGHAPDNPSRNQTMSSPGTQTEPRYRPVSMIRLTGFMTLFLGGLLIIIVSRTFASKSDLLAYLKGESLAVDSHIKELQYLGEAEGIGASFVLTNITNSSIELVGAKVSCPCVVLNTFPATILPGERYLLNTRIDNQLATPFRGAEVELYYGPSGETPLRFAVIAKRSKGEDRTRP
jgi:hypothetical protein